MILSSHSVSGTNPYNTSYKTPRFTLSPLTTRLILRGPFSVVRLEVAYKAFFSASSCILTDRSDKRYCMQTESFSLRPVSEDDLEALVKIDAINSPEPWTLTHFKEELKKPYSKTLVLTDDETDTQVIGFITYWVQVEGVSLLNISVHPDWKNLGFGQKLMRAMINEAVRDEIAKIALEVRESNLGAIRLYERSGFKKTHERKNFYHNGETGIVMELQTSSVPGVVQ